MHRFAVSLITIAGEMLHELALPSYLRSQAATTYMCSEIESKSRREKETLPPGEPGLAMIHFRRVLIWL